MNQTNMSPSALLDTTNDTVIQMMNMEIVPIKSSSIKN